MEHKRFAQSILEWMSMNEQNISNFVAQAPSLKFSQASLKVYLHIFKQMIKEKLNCVISLNHFVGYLQI